jgi:HEAT repeat protein
MSSGGGNASDADRATRRAVQAQILPVLRWTLTQSGARDPDVLSSALIALGKTATEPSDLHLLLAALRDREANDVVREAGAIACGLLRRTRAEDAFDGKALDGVRQALLDVIEEGDAPLRVRCFAAFGLGLLGDQAGEPPGPASAPGSLAVRGLWARAAKSTADDEMGVALLSALSLQARDGVPGEVIDGLRTACIKGTIARRNVGPLTHACAALALARLGDGSGTGLLLGLARGKRNDAALRRSAIAGLSVLVPRLEGTLRPLAAAALSDVARSGDPDTAGLALAALGRFLRADFADGCSEVAEKTDAMRVLLDAVRSGGPFTRPFAALALGHAGSAEGRAADVPTAAFLRVRALDALRGPAADVNEDPDVRGAFCIALGLLGDDRAIPALVGSARRNAGFASLRADACTALGMLGARTPEVMAVLRAAVAERSEDDLQREAARALAALGDATAVPILLAQLATAFGDGARARVAVALGALGHASAVPALVQIVNAKRTSDPTRAIALATLGLLGDVEPYRSLARIGCDTSYLIRTDALHEALSLL